MRCDVSQPACPGVGGKLHHKLLSVEKQDRSGSESGLEEKLAGE